jgi:predicted transcriptional regulator
MPDKESPLRRIRDELGVSQEAVARRTSLTTGTYRRAEDGFPVKYSTAQEILHAINSLLQEHNKPPLTLDDLGLNLM